MGLDFVVLDREDDDSTENWPGHEVDARRADDPDPVVQEELRKVYSSQFSPAALARSASFQGWAPPRLPGLFGLLIYPIVAIFYWLSIPIWLLKDARRRTPSFEAWKAALAAQRPPPVVVKFGPNCPPEGRPQPAAIVQWYGFRGRVVQPEHNVLARWWAAKNEVDLNLIYYGDGRFDDKPRSETPFRDLEINEPTIGDMAALFAKMEADCTETFPEIAAAADESPDVEADMGPYPERGLDEVASPVDLAMIRGAARFFAFWEGRSYPIAADY